MSTITDQRIAAILTAAYHVDTYPDRAAVLADCRAAMAGDAAARERLAAREDAAAVRELRDAEANAATWIVIATAQPYAATHDAVGAFAYACALGGADAAKKRPATAQAAQVLIDRIRAVHAAAERARAVDA